jgi:alkyl hydroperoxide reductase subunit AhpC
MTELREFARHREELEKLGVQLIPISFDNQQHAHDVWQQVAEKQFPILSDPAGKVVRKYGLLHSAGHAGADIALRTTILIGPEGRERWRRVSQSVPDIPSWDETQMAIRQAQSETRVQENR